MSLTDAERLRKLLGEEVPETGSDVDTAFTDEQIGDLLTQAQGALNRAAYLGWVQKMAETANYVNITEGNASREMGELHKNAKRMVDYFGGFAPTASRGRARVGRIRRRSPGEL